MKKLLVVIALLCAFTSCTSSNELGKCVGISQPQDPKLNYDVNLFNAAMGVIFFEMLAPPIMVLHHETYCPVSVK